MSDHLDKSRDSNLAQTPESIYIKSDVPASDRDSLTILNKLTKSGNSQPFSSDCDALRQKPESSVVTGLDNLAHHAEKIYIKPDVPGNHQDSLTIGELEANPSASQTSNLDSCSTLSPRENPETTVATGLDNLAQSARKYIYKARCARQ